MAALSTHRSLSRKCAQVGRVQTGELARTRTWHVMRICPKPIDIHRTLTRCYAPSKYFPAASCPATVVPGAEGVLFLLAKTKPCAHLLDAPAEHTERATNKAH